MTKRKYEVKTINVQEELREAAQLIEAANGGDRDAMTVLRVHLNQKPYLWDALAALLPNARKSCPELIAPRSPLIQEVWQKQINQLRDELDPGTVLEDLLVDRICLCWLHIQEAEISYNQQRQRGYGSQCAYLERRTESAQNLYLKAIKALAQVRKLELPMIGQLNIGQNQVNAAVPNASFPDGDSEATDTRLTNA